MSTSTFQTPIVIDPNQNSTDQVSFINQNFQNLASTLETNSFRIVDQGIASITTSGLPINFLTIPHNLGFAPVPFAYLNDVAITSGSTTITTDGNMPLPTWTSLTIDTIKATATNSGQALPIVSFEQYIQAVADTKNLYIILLDATATSGENYSVQYYLTQQQSSS